MCIRDRNNQELPRIMPKHKKTITIKLPFKKKLVLKKDLASNVIGLFVFMACLLYTSIIPKDDGIDATKPPENMGVDSGDDVLRSTYGLKPDPMNPILLTSAGREVIQVKLHRPDEAEKPRSAQSIHLLVQIGLSAEVPHQLPRVEVPIAVKSDVKELSLIHI